TLMTSIIMVFIVCKCEIDDLRVTDVNVTTVEMDSKFNVDLQSRETIYFVKKEPSEYITKQYQLSLEDLSLDD
ncbi:347_t:CDS:2, partial [Acaulospora morrowiae]